MRQDAGLTQLDMEIRCGISQTQVSRIENGQKNIEFSTLVMLAEALDVPLHQFFKG